MNYLIYEFSETPIMLWVFCYVTYGTYELRSRIRSSVDNQLKTLINFFDIYIIILINQNLNFLPFVCKDDIFEHN